MRISDWSSDVCSSDLAIDAIVPRLAAAERPVRGRVAKVVEHHPPIEHAARTDIPPPIPGVPVIRHPPSMRFDAAETAIAGSQARKSDVSGQSGVVSVDHVGVRGNINKTIYNDIHDDETH